MRWLITLIILSSGLGLGPSAEAERIYVPNYDEDTVDVLDLQTGVPVRTITVGDEPFAVALDGAGERVYVTNYNAGTVSVISTVTLSVIDTVATGGRPISVAVSPNGRTVYVLDQLNDKISTIDPATLTVSGSSQFPSGSRPITVAVHPDGSRLYVTLQLLDVVWVLDSATLSMVTSIDAEIFPVGVAVTSDGTRALVASDAGLVTVIDAITDTRIDSVFAAAGGRYIALNPSSTTAYISNLDAQSVTVFDLATLSVVGTVPGDAYGLTMSLDGSVLYATSPSSDTVRLIDTMSLQGVGSLSTGQRPFAPGHLIRPFGIFADGFEAGDTSAWSVATP